jgi:hypothetical protein
MRVEERLTRVLSVALSDIADETQLRVRQQGPRTFKVTVDADRQPLEFDALWTPRGWPSDVRSIISDNQPSSSYTVVVAPEVSPGARRFLANHGYGWADEVGHARIVIPPRLAVILGDIRAVVPAERVED